MVAFMFALCVCVYVCRQQQQTPSLIQHLSAWYMLPGQRSWFYSALPWWQLEWKLIPYQKDRCCRWCDWSHPHMVDQKASKPAAFTHVDLEIQSEPEVLGRCWQKSFSWPVVSKVLKESRSSKICIKSTLPLSSVKEGHQPLVVLFVNRGETGKNAQHWTSPCIPTLVYPARTGLQWETSCLEMPADSIGNLRLRWWFPSYIVRSPSALRKQPVGKDAD